MPPRLVIVAPPSPIDPILFDLFAALPDAVIATDDVGSAILLWNEQATALLGWDEPAMAGRNLFDLFATAEQGRIRQLLAFYQSPATGLTPGFSFFATARHCDGHELAVHVSSTRLAPPGMARSIVLLIVHSMPESQSTGYLLTREHLIGLISHDIVRPIEQVAALTRVLQRLIEDRYRPEDHRFLIDTLAAITSTTQETVRFVQEVIALERAACLRRRELPDATPAEG